MYDGGMSDLHRTQLFLERSQYEELARLAERDCRSISQVIREIVDAGLAHRRRGREEKLEVLREISSRRRALEARYGRYRGDPVADARADRERQIEEVLRGERDR